MNERKLSKERIEEALERCEKSLQNVESGRPDTVIRTLHDALHDLRLADAEIERLRGTLEALPMQVRYLGCSDEVVDFIESQAQAPKDAS